MRRRCSNASSSLGRTSPESWCCHAHCSRLEVRQLADGNEPRVSLDLGFEGFGGAGRAVILPGNASAKVRLSQ